MKVIYAVMMLVGLSVGAVGQVSSGGAPILLNQRETAASPFIVVDHTRAMSANAILDSGGSLTGEQMRDLFIPVKENGVTLFPPESLKDLDGALRVALGVDVALRPCRASELRSAELTAFIRPSHGGYCKAGSLTKAKTPSRQRHRPKGRQQAQQYRKRGFTELRSTDTDADITEDGKHWFHWSGPSCKHKLPAFSHTSLGPPGGTRGSNVTPAGLWAEPVKYAHAQLQQKPAAILPATEIKVPERENAMLRDLQAQIDKLRESYKLSEYEKEMKALGEIYESGKKTLDAKYKVAEFQKEAAPLSDQGQVIVRFAILNAKLTEEQKVNLELVKADDGNWSWRPKAKLAQ